MPSHPRPSRPGATLFIASLVILLAIAPRAGAGTICGTVRDADTNQPVAQAAVFLYDNSGDYTGKHTATDIAGAYCLGDIAPGVYTLQVRRDDYLTEVIENIEVTDVGTGVDVTAHPRLMLRAWPNPASDRVRFGIAVTEGTPVTLEVFDVKGRFVRGWKGVGRDGLTIDWNLREIDGGPVASGVYFVRLRTETQSLTRRFVRFR